MVKALYTEQKSIQANSAQNCTEKSKIELILNMNEMVLGSITSFIRRYAQETQTILALR